MDINLNVKMGKRELGWEMVKKWKKTISFVLRNTNKYQTHYD